MQKVIKFTGVYYNLSKKRKYNNKPDRCFYINYQDKNKKLVLEKVGMASEGYTAEFASKKRSERVAQVKGNDIIPSDLRKEEPLTFSDIWDDFYAYAKINKKSHRDDYFRYEKHIKPIFANILIRNITTEDIENFKGDLLDTDKSDLSNQTVCHVLGIMRTAFNRAIKSEKFSGKNPVSNVEFPSTNNTNRLRYLTPFEVDEMLLPMLCEASESTYQIAYISIYTGMRADEIFSLRWQDINLESRTIFILETKNTESRTAYITDGILEIFKEKKKGLPHEYVFPQEIVRGATSKGGWRQALPTTKKNEVSKTYFRVVEEIGFNDGIVDTRYKVCFHTLRHTFGSWLAIRGESLQTIAELMGHKRISQTMRYAHLCPDKKKLAVAGLHERG
jgi:integrase